MLIGVGLGLLIGFVRSVAYNDIEPSVGEGRLSHKEFELALRRPARNSADKLTIEEITVFRLPNGDYVAKVLYLRENDARAAMGRVKLKPNYQWYPLEQDVLDMKASLGALRQNKADVAMEKMQFLRRFCEALRIKPADPPDCLLEYLRRVKDFKGRHLTFTYAWWNQPRVMITAWVLGCFVLVGVIWPFVVNLIAFGSLWRPAEAEKKPQKAKPRSTAPAQIGKKPVAGPTQKDMDELLRLEAEMEARLRESGMEITPSAPAPSTPETDEPVRKLTATQTEVQTGPETPQEQKHFDRKEGDWYPVERHVKKDEE